MEKVDVVTVDGCGMNRRFHALAAMAALSGCVPCEIPDFSSGSHKPVGKGHVVDSDNGKGKKYQPRNQPCQCGSGLKAKKCCVYETEPQQ